jgi:hypothetical protein
MVITLFSAPIQTRCPIGYSRAATMAKSGVMSGIGPRKIVKSDGSRALFNWSYKNILHFVMHQFISTLGVGVAAATGIFFGFDLMRIVNSDLFSSDNAQRVISRTPYFPAQILIACSWGWILGRRLKHRSMLWVWVVPLLILVYAVSENVSLTPHFTSALAITDHSALSRYFGFGCRVEDRCIDQLTITMPFYASAAYSLGAFLQRQVRWGARVVANDQCLKT